MMGLKIFYYILLFNSFLALLDCCYRCYPSPSRHKFMYSQKSILI